jgi:amino acid transporter
VAKTKRPQCTTNLAFFVAMLLAGSLYVGISVVLNLMTPYYKQEDVAVLTHPFTEYADVFRLLHPKKIINCIVIFTVFCKLIGVSAKSGKLIETMATDGFFLEFLQKSVDTRKLQTMQFCWQAF